MRELSSIRTAVLHDAALEVVTSPAVMPIVASWLPSYPTDSVRPIRAAAPLARMSVSDEVPAVPAHSGATILSGRTVIGWADDTGRRVLLASGGGDGAAVIELDGGVATCGVCADAPHARATLMTMLVVASSLLIARMGRALIHAAAVVHPLTGGAWLLVGDSGDGKSTSTATLVRAGWKFLADDNVVLSGTDDSHGVLVDGWPQPFHLDAGWSSGSPNGRRSTVPLSNVGEGMWAATAPLAGILLPKVTGGARTTVRRVTAADGMACLVRQCPWMMADAESAGSLLALLKRAAIAPVFALDLALDSFANPAVLSGCLATIG